MPCPDVARWVSAARPGGGERAAARLRARLHALQHRKGLNEEFMYLFALSNVSNAGNFDNHFILVVFKAIFVNVFILIVAISR